MNDLELLAALGDETPLPAPETLAAARARLIGAIAPPAAFAPPAHGRRRTDPRAIWIAGTAAAAAVAIAVAVQGAPSPHVAASASASASARSASAAAPSSSTSARDNSKKPPAATARLTAAWVLDRAAAAALTQRTVVPRPDQFVFWKTVDSASGTALTWQSVDGARNGFVLSAGVKTMLWGCKDGWQTVRPDPGSGRAWITQRCVAQPAFLPGMPASASAMPDFLARQFGPVARDPQVAMKITEYLLGSVYLLPGQRAALYQFFVTIPGLTVVPHVRDYAGRPGVGVSMTRDGFKAMWIFDDKTFAYLGYAEWSGHTEVAAGAVLKVAIVDSAGQRS